MDCKQCNAQRMVINVVKHDLMQLHSGGFVGGGQAGQLHSDGNGINVFSIRGWIPIRNGRQLQDGGSHFGQWQTIPSLPLVLAVGDNGHGQSQLGGFMATSLGSLIAITLDVGKMIAM